MNFPSFENMLHVLFYLYSLCSKCITLVNYELLFVAFFQYIRSLFVCEYSIQVSGQSKQTTLFAFAVVAYWLLPSAFIHFIRRKKKFIRTNLVRENELLFSLGNMANGVFLFIRNAVHQAPKCFHQQFRTPPTGDARSSRHNKFDKLKKLQIEFKFETECKCLL